MKFALPDRLPKGVAQLGALRKQACLEMEVFRARRDARQEFSAADVARLEYLLNGRDKIDEVNRSRVARHEAGHAVVAALVGGQVAVAEVYAAGVTDEDGSSGVCQYVPASVAVAQNEHLIAAAGAVAETVWEHGRHPTRQQIEARLSGSRDGELLRRWALTAGYSAACPISAVSPLIHSCWPGIESLAVQLEQRGEISHKHVVKALGLSNDHTRHPFELANIRGGFRAVPAVGQQR